MHEISYLNSSDSPIEVSKEVLGEKMVEDLIAQKCWKTRKNTEQEPCRSTCRSRVGKEQEYGRSRAEAEAKPPYN